MFLLRAPVVPSRGPRFRCENPYKKAQAPITLIIRDPTQFSVLQRHWECRDIRDINQCLYLKFKNYISLDKDSSLMK